MSLKFAPLAAVAVLALGVAGLGMYSGPVRAMDEEDISTPADTAPPVPSCVKGQILDTKSNTCIAATTVVTCDKGLTYNADTKSCVKSTALNDEQLYYQGRLLALAGYYDSAIDTLGTIHNQTSNVLTMIGYSTRKEGDVEQGIAIYAKALALDPNNLSTHEYLGEGYLAEGRIDLAETQLDTLQNLCGKNCVQFQSLSNALYGDGVWN